jgi:integrase
MRGEGSVYERKDGYWVAQYKGQYRYAKTKKDAKKKLLDLLSAGEVLQQPNRTTVASFMDRFMDRWIAFAERNLKLPTVKRYREALEIYVKPNLGTMKIQKVDALTVQQMYSNMLRSGLSPATIKLVHCVLSSAFKRAVKWGMLQHNILENVESPKIFRKEVEVFTPEEVQALLSAATRDRLHAAYILAFSTGIRGGKLLGLEHKHLNLDAGTLDVKQTITLNG